MRPFAFPALVSVVWLLALVWVVVWAVVDAASASVSAPTTTPLTKSRHPKSQSQQRQRQRLVLGVDGGTESIRACWFDADTGRVVGRSCAVPYTTHHPQPGWAEQDPNEWWTCMGQAVRESVDSVQQELDEKSFEWCAMAVDTTCCSVVALDASYEPLRPCLLWMDQRSARQCAQILELCTSDSSGSGSPPEPALAVNCHGNGPISAEWMTPKALWLAQHEPDVWNAATTICEYQDYINFKLTGYMTASACNAASRWHWNGVECLEAADSTDNPHPGRPLSLYQRIGIPELAQKLPRTCLAMGSRIGHDGLTAEAAAHLNLPTGLPVIQGGPDAFVGMVGLGCIAPGQVCLITGSSHLHCVVTANATTAAGIWGAYRGAPLATTNFAEGGQSSTGSILKWAKDKLFHGGIGDSENNDDKQDSLLTYQVLDDEASRIAPGADGLVALETFQGSRTPVTDALARGALLGLTLSHTRAHVWRALLEAVCSGTRACLDALLAVAVVDDTNASSADNHPKDFDSSTEIVMAGGVTRSELWLQMHADVTGKTIVIRDQSENAPLLGCAILASVGVGIYPSVPDAMAAMVQTRRQVHPNMDAAARYNQIYHSVYRKVAEAVRPIAHALHDLRGGGDGREDGPDGQTQDNTKRQVPWRGGSDLSASSTSVANNPSVPRPNSITQTAIVSPSLLACDWANIQSEVHRCLQAGLRRLHVDIFDSVFLDSPDAFTFGPQMVRAIRQSCESYLSKNKDDGEGAAITLDLHMCVDRPNRFVPTMAHVAAMGQKCCFIFQWEAMNDAIVSFDLAQSVLDAGMSCGVSINPSTPVSAIYPLLETNLVRVVDILAVEPGFGGQSFQEIALHKLSELRQWRHDHGLVFDIMIDGGINADTAASALHAGADILVAGTFLFQHPKGLANGARVLLDIKSSRV